MEKEHAMRKAIDYREMTFDLFEVMLPLTKIADRIDELKDISSLSEVEIHGELENSYGDDSGEISMSYDITKDGIQVWLGYYVNGNEVADRKIPKGSFDLTGIANEVEKIHKEFLEEVKDEM